MLRLMNTNRIRLTGSELQEYEQIVGKCLSSPTSVGQYNARLVAAAELWEHTGVSEYLDKAALARRMLLVPAASTSGTGKTRTAR